MKAKEDVDVFFARKKADAEKRWKGTRRGMPEEVSCDRCGVSKAPKETMGGFVTVPIPDSDGDDDDVKVNICLPCARKIYVDAEAPWNEETMMKASRADHAVKAWIRFPGVF